MSGAEVVVVGSLNMDLVVRAAHLPAPGETILGGGFSTVPGGKGGNQAVAAARLGARTAMVGEVGDDAFGRALRAGLEADGIDCAAVRSVPGEPTGVALIVVDEEGRNGIVVAPGANGRLAPEDVPEPLLARAKVVVLQLEVPLETVARTARRARALGRTVVLNPAPARPLPPGLLADADLLVPNEIEAGMLAGLTVDSVDRAIEAGLLLRKQGARTVLVTLGERGVVLVGEREGAQHFPARPVKAVDTTAAGDTFIGGLGAALAGGRPLAEAIGFAQTAAAISVTRPGAQPSIPWRRELEAIAI